MKASNRFGQAHGIKGRKGDRSMKKGLGVLAAFVGVMSALGGQSSGKKKGTHCDRDCDNCPPHYGYRYGRWYYGHGHQHGCQKGGNGGAKGITYRD